MSLNCSSPLSATGYQNGHPMAITLVTAALTYATRLNPLWLFAVAAALGYAGYL